MCIRDRFKEEFNKSALGNFGSGWTWLVQKTDGSVVNIDDMKPQTLDSHCSAKPVRFVLEMNEGWFAKRGIKAGSKLRGGPFGQ